MTRFLLTAAFLVGLSLPAAAQGTPPAPPSPPAPAPAPAPPAPPAGPAQPAAGQAMVFFKQGFQIPLDSLAVKGSDIELTKQAPGRVVGQKFPITSVETIGVDAPPAIVLAMGKILDKAPAEAPGIIDPVRTTFEPYLALPGSLWHQAMRIKVLAYGAAGDRRALDTTLAELMKQKPALEDTATIELARILAETGSRPDQRIERLAAFQGEHRTPTTNAVAQYFVAETLAAQNKDAEALDAYLRVPCLNPAAEPVVVAACEVRAGLRVQRLGPTRKAEAAQLFRSAAGPAAGTSFAETAAASLKDLQ